MQSSSFSGPYDRSVSLKSLEMTCTCLHLSGACLEAEKRPFVSTSRFLCLRDTLSGQAHKKEVRVHSRVQSTAQHARVRWVHLHSLSDDIGAAPP
ncbi:hypothetical protein L596_013156 [Steinernema carpocapsae]|uniref:Uncharacterized protein n=1 Tax=Steinernema carpocapsae TaxID=34508 RepID=A0A4U5NZZ4_STECR|nr:hypothetical protein L596_013156 [Steinernema carpocapsae]